MTDPQGATSYTYDGTGERRGLETGETITRPGASGGSLSFSATYNAAGDIATQALPGSVTQTNVYDTAGDQVGLVYSGQVTPVTATTDPTTGIITTTDGTPTTGEWLGFSQTDDVLGRARVDYTGDGAAQDDSADGSTLPVGDAGSYTRTYTYDTAGRLVTVDDQTADPDTALTSSTPCTERAYTYDADSRRTALKTTTSSTGACGSGTSTTTTYAYDTADRPTTGANGSGTYTYDALGRQTVIPAADAPTTGNGNITLGYYDNDAIKSITQGSTSTSYTLDSAARRSVETTTTGSTSTTITRHYDDDSDDPAWITSLTGTASSITRYADSVGGDLGATIAGSGATQIGLADLHGNEVTNIDLAATDPTSATATSIDGWSDYTEYGTPINSTETAAVTGTLGYGWLGSKQRSTTTTADAGLTLMGSRLYNPTRGLFTSCDPVPGGSANAYAYPTDPINTTDINGQWWRWARRGWSRTRYARRWVWRNKYSIAEFGGCFLGGEVACGLASAAYAFHDGWNTYHHARRHRWRAAAYAVGWDAAWSVAGMRADDWIGERYKHESGAITKHVLKFEVSSGMYFGQSVYRHSFSRFL